MKKEDKRGRLDRNVDKKISREAFVQNEKINFGLCAGFIQIGVKALYGGNLFLPQEVKGFHNLVEIANGSF